VGCLLENVSWRSDFVLQLLLPVAFFVWRIAVFGLSCMQDWLKSTDPMAASKIRRQRVHELISRQLQFMSVMYLTVCRYAFSPFLCLELEDGGSVLRDYPGQSCDDSGLLRYRIGGAIAILVYAVGFPFGLAAALANMKFKQLSTSPDYIAAFGWLYTMYEAKSFYYGLLTILRRTLFAIIAIVPDQQWQSMLAVFAIMFFLVYHVKLEPYNDFLLDRLDYFFLSCLWVRVVHHSPCPSVDVQRSTPTFAQGQAPSATPAPTRCFCGASGYSGQRLHIPNGWSRRP
jgi:hypothetical protein